MGAGAGGSGGGGGKRFPPQDAQIRHIFRRKEGHLPDTPYNRARLINLVNKERNYVGRDALGTDWYAELQSDGSQLWARVRGSVIVNAGLNTAPRPWDPVTGLNHNPYR